MGSTAKTADQLELIQSPVDHTTAQSAFAQPVAEFLMRRLDSRGESPDQYGERIARGLRRMLTGEHRLIGFWTLDGYCIELDVQLHELPPAVWSAERALGPRSDRPDLSKLSPKQRAAVRTMETIADITTATRPGRAA